MNRLTARATTAAALVFLGITLLAGERIGYAQPRSDSDAVKAAVDTFHGALANLDIAKMQAVWVQEPYAVLVNPRDKAPATAGMRSRKTGRTASLASGRS